MSNNNRYLRNSWYVAALSSELGAEQFLVRTIMDVPVLLYRKEDDSPVALHDRCPHRFAPLHLGSRDGDEVVCKYHGLKFNCEGQCTENPHGNGHIPKAAKVRSYPLLEKFGFIWIWMGEKASDPALLQDFSELENGPDNGVGYTYMRMTANYKLILDNVMDLSHVDHVHGDAINTRGQLSPKSPKVESVGDAVVTSCEWEQTPPMLIFADFLPKPESEARHYFKVTWTPPTNLQLSVGATQSESGFDELVGQYDVHLITPESPNSTHYFFASRRNYNEEDPEYNAQKIQAMHDAFEHEDGPIIKAVHDMMGDNEFFDLNPVLTSNDVAAVRMRKKLESLIDEDSGVLASD
ncbi:aromatic ring-hydroxylating dioxygenase subunit alpha [Marinobacter nauticus]|uniref:Rieske (2Fe-2S) protein n=1 Tax=Marinobacter nauticus TaxID=2743 RepID=A0A1M2URX6_MARNT|nr:aromatic ring-hydroxylating dioxygenase subunit alpha [Marinobacter nauticus]OJS98050.1 Rieske (2Fe-2S) protein [Marinobacter nauticus]